MTEQTVSQNDILRLKEEVEQMLHRKISTPKDFTFLSEEIFSRLNVLLSPTTLKRVWGYLANDGSHREFTLSVIAQFAGYRDWKAFCQSTEADAASQSNLILSRKLSSYSLERGQTVSLSWRPDRTCRIEYQGNCRFIVLESGNCKLTEGDTFRCSIFIEGEPLYVDDLKHGEFSGISYVAGKKDGIRFQLD